MVGSLYAGLLALLFLYLSVMVIKARIKEQKALGINGSKFLEKHIRAHANFAEYTPIILILLFLAESQEAPFYFIHFIGILYLLGRISHAYSLIFAEKYEGDKITTTLKYRQFGMVCTFVSLLSSAVANVILSLL